MAAPRPVRVAVVGDAFVDVVAGTIAPDQLPKWGGDTEVARPIELQPGGSALNTATHLATLARDAPPEVSALAVTLHTVVGADAFGDVLRTHLAARDVALSSPALEGVPTGVCIVLSGTEDRSFITHYGAARAFSIEHLDQARLMDADHLHIGGFYSCTNLRAKLKPLLETARAKGITTSLDTNYDSTEQWAGLEELLPLLDVFMPNEVEAMAVAKTNTVDAAMTYLSARVGGLTLIKIGAGGARAYCAQTKRTFQQTSFKTNVVDVTGAGDSFNAGFLAAWKTSGGNVQKGLQWGCATASQCVAALGACSMCITSRDVAAVVTQGEPN